MKKRWENRVRERQGGNRTKMEGKTEVLAGLNGSVNTEK